MIKIYKNRKFEFSIATGILLWLFSLFLQSCSVTANKLGVLYVNRERLRQDRRQYQNGVFPGELTKNVEKLVENGFVSEQAEDGDDINVKKHLMFVFFHCIRLKQESFRALGELNREDIVLRILEFFGDNGNDPNEDAVGLMFRAQRVNGNDGEPSIRFIFTHLLTQDDPNRTDNRNRINPPLRLSPRVYLRGDPMDNFFLVTGNEDDPDLVGDEDDLERVDVDHLLKDNIITIEIPLPVHQMKTRFLDKLISPLGEEVRRDPQAYWTQRLREQVL